MLDTLLHGLNVFLGYLSFYLTRPPNISDRAWKGILGIQDLTRMRFGNRENEKYPEGKLDFAASREAGFPKIWARDAVFFSRLSEIREDILSNGKYKVKHSSVQWFLL